MKKKNYHHMFTFKEDGKSVMHQLDTADLLPTILEWSDFIKVNYGKNDKWVVIAHFTLKS